MNIIQFLQINTKYITLRYLENDYHIYSNNNLGVLLFMGPTKSVL